MIQTILSQRIFLLDILGEVTVSCRDWKLPFLWSLTGYILKKKETANSGNKYGLQMTYISGTS